MTENIETSKGETKHAIEVTREEWKGVAMRLGHLVRYAYAYLSMKDGELRYGIELRAHQAEDMLPALKKADLHPAHTVFLWCK